MKTPCKIFKEGDTIPGIGMVEPNHCGMPWVMGLKGPYYGVVQVQDKLCDALTGKVLSQRSLNFRLNNLKYDYESKAGNCKVWREINQPYGPYYHRYQKNPIQAFWYRLKCKLRGK